jgi:hypothetical protein
VFTVKGAGADIYGTSDQFRFVYRTLTGDGEMVARVASLQNTSGWAKAGVMIRESLAAGSRHAFARITVGHGFAFQRRSTTDGTTKVTNGKAGVTPAWVKIVRKSSTFSAYSSTDGVNWSLIGSDTISMASTTYVGLAVTSHNTSMATTATFSNVSLMTSSGTVASGTSGTRMLQFSASADDWMVNSYALDIFSAGANVATAKPVLSQGLGKPAAVNGQIGVDITSAVNNLSAGSYVATVSAIGMGGTSQSAPSPSFTR